MNNPNMTTMGGPVGAPMPVMNNGALPLQPGQARQPPGMNSDTRTTLNTYIYEYFLRNNMYECARAMLDNNYPVNIKKDSPGGRRDENGNLIGNSLGDDSMDTDVKEEEKRPEDFPAPNVPLPPYPDSCFLYEWFCLFWDMLNAQKGKGGSSAVSQYVQHTQQQSRMRQHEQQQLLRNMRPDFAQTQYQQQMMRNMQNNAMNMNMKPGNQLPRTAMANNQNPQITQMLHQKASQMQRDPSDMDGNRMRPGSPGSTDNAPSPSKRPRLEGAPFNQGMMVPNGGRPVQGMPGQNQAFANPNPAVQAKTIATYAANLQQHHGNQMPTKPLPNVTGPQGQSSPMVPQGPDGATLGAFYNPGDMAQGNGMVRQGPGNGQATGNSNHALQDYQMQLMLLEQQNKKRLMMARQEQDVTGVMPRPDGVPVPGPGGSGGPPGPNGQPFPGTSPGARSGASPNPADQMKRASQMGNTANMGSPLPEGAQSRSSPNPINFMTNQMNPENAQHFYKGMAPSMDMNMVNPQLSAGMRPPNSHPGQQPFNGMTPQQQQQMMAARQAQQASQGGPPVQWQGPNGQVPQGPQPQQGTPQQRSMAPPPSAPAAGNNNANSRNATSSPQTSNAAPPTPQQANKAAPKKKENKGAKNKAATQKKSNTNLNAGATPAADAAQEPEPPTPATPSFNKPAQNAPAPAQVVPNGQPAAPAPAPAPVVPAPHPDPSQNGGFNMDSTGLDFSDMAFANPLTSNDVLNDFDFDSFLHDSNGDDSGAFDFTAGGPFLEGGEIGAE